MIFIFEKEPYVYQTTAEYKEKNKETNPSFDEMKKFIKSDKYKGTIEKFEETKIGNRDAIRYWNEEVHGFIYFINIDDLTEASSCMRMIITSSQGDMQSISDAMNDERAKIVINSFGFEGVNNK